MAVLEIGELRYEPFGLIYKASTYRQICDDIFESAGFKPYVLIETSSPPSILALVQSAICCGIIPRHYVNPLDERLSSFVLASYASWDLCISYRKNSYLSDGSREFIRLAQGYWEKKLIPPQTD